MDWFMARLRLDVQSCATGPTVRETTCGQTEISFRQPMPRDPFIREKFTKEQTAARKFAKEYFERFPKDRYQTEVESWRNLQSANIELTMKRPVELGS
jgi:hypothetical protein